MKKFIFELLTSPLSITDNPIINYIFMTLIGLIAFKLAWNFVRETGIRGEMGSLLHWTIRGIVTFIIWLIISIIVYIIKGSYSVIISIFSLGGNSMNFWSDLLVQFVGSILGFGTGYIVAYVFYKREQKEKSKNEKEIFKNKLQLLKEEINFNYSILKEEIERGTYTNIMQIHTLVYEDIMKSELNIYFNKETIEKIFRLYVDYYIRAKCLYMANYKNNIFEIKIMNLREQNETAITLIDNLVRSL